MRTVFADGSHICRMYAAHTKNRRRIAKSSRLHCGKRVHKRFRHLGKLQFKVIFFRRNKGFRRGLFTNRFAQTPFKLRHVFRFNRQPCRLSMAAKSNKQIPTGTHRFMDIHAGDRSSRTDANIPISGKQDRRPFVFFNQSGGGQPDHTRIPPLAADDNSALIHEVNLLTGHFVCLLKNLNFQFAPTNVVLIEFLSNFSRGIHSSGGQQLHAARSKRKAAPRIDTRCHTKRNVRRTDLLQIDTRRFHQRNQSRSLRRRHRRQTIVNDHAIFIHQRHDVRNRCQRRQFPKRLNCFCSAHRLYQLKGHACAAQSTERIMT